MSLNKIRYTDVKKKGVYIGNIQNKDYYYYNISELNEKNLKKISLRLIEVYKISKSIKFRQVNNFEKEEILNFLRDNNNNNEKNQNNNLINLIDDFKKSIKRYQVEKQQLKNKLKLLENNNFEIIKV